MKLRVSLTQQGEDIKGVVALPGDPAFVLEALYLIIERFAQQSELGADEVIKDLWRVHQMNKESI